jgi:uncharacterized iron-regulated protein
MLLDEIEHGRDAILPARAARPLNRWRLLAAAVALATLAACAHRAEAPLAGRIWDTHAERFVAPSDVYQAARARYVILGETHDNPEHHRLQLAVLQALAARGERRILAMEQFDAEYQPALDAARAAGADAERLADAGHFERRGWNWPLYRPLVQFALEHGWPIVAANLSRADARAIVADPARSHLPPAPASIEAALERDIIEGHCGKAPEPKLLTGMVEAQRARDAHMASVLMPGSVLIAGAGHARRDRGVPIYLRDDDVLSIAFVEVENGNAAGAKRADRASYDFLWFTAPAERPDPCMR